MGFFKFEHVVWFMCIRNVEGRQIRVVWQSSFLLVGVIAVHCFWHFLVDSSFLIELNCCHENSVWLSWFVGRLKRPEFDFDLELNATCLSKTPATPNTKRPKVDSAGEVAQTGAEGGEGLRERRACSRCGVEDARAPARVQCLLPAQDRELGTWWHQRSLR